MGVIQIPTSNIGQNATCNRGSVAQSTLSYIKAVLTYPTQGAAYPLRGNYINPNYYFWVYVSLNNGSYGSVSITYPWSESSTSNVGQTYQVYTGTYTYITINATPVYGRSFNYWSASYPGGPVISYSRPYNVTYNGGYESTSIYANFI